jgi:hypothetical protein
MTLEEVHKRFPLFLAERALAAEDADALLRELLVEGQTWTQDEWWIAGEARKAPRLTAVYEMTPGGGEATSGAGADEENEDASLLENELRAPSALMRAAARAAGEAATTGVIRSSSETCSGSTRNFSWSPTYAVANLYRDGSDRVGAHADRLTSLGPDAVIAGVSLGRVRTFRLKTRWPRNPDGSDDCAVDVPLPHNSVCVMLPGCQELWTHEILRDGAAGGGGGGGKGDASRVSLTFRKKEQAWDASAPVVPVRTEVRAEDETRGRGTSLVRARDRGRPRGRERPRTPGDHARAVLLHVRHRERREAVRVFQTRPDADGGVSNTVTDSS